MPFDGPMHAGSLEALRVARPEAVASSGSEITRLDIPDSLLICMNLTSFLETGDRIPSPEHFCTSAVRSHRAQPLSIRNFFTAGSLSLACKTALAASEMVAIGSTRKTSNSLRRYA